MLTFRRLLVLFLLAAAPIFGFECANQLNLRNAREAEVKKDASRLLALVNTEQARIIDDIRNVLGTVVGAGIAQAEPSACQATLSHLASWYPSHLTISVADGSGVIRCSTYAGSIGTRISSRLSFEQAVGTGDFVMGEYNPAPSTGRPALPFALAFRDVGGAPAGVVVALLDVSWLERSLAAKEWPPDAVVLLADRHGVPLVRVPAMPEIIGKPLPERYRGLLQGSRDTVADVVGFDGTPRIVAYSPPEADVAGIFTSVGIARDVAMAPFDMAMRLTLGLFAGVLLLTGAATAWGVARFARVQQHADAIARKMASVLATTTDAVVEVDRHWRITYVNERIKALIPAEEVLVGMNAWQAFPELADTAVRAHCQRAMTERVSVDFTMLGPRTGRWYAVRAFPSDEGLVVYLQDVNERRLLEHALRRSEERLRQALISARAGSFDFDLDTGALDWSDESFRLFGLDLECAPATLELWTSVLHPDDRDETLAVLEQNLRGGTTDFVHEYRILRPNGEIAWIATSGRVVRDADGNPMGVSGIHTDATETKELEAALRKAKAEAEDANVAKSKFLAAASHDLRQPLQSMVLFAGLLQTQLTGTPGARSLDMIEGGLGTLKEMLDSLLDVSRLDAAVIEPRLEDFELASLLGEIGAAYDPIAARKGLAFEIVPPCRLFVRSDRTLLGRMVRNLLENAIRYTHAGYVRLRFERDGDSVRIAIHDSGIGIAADHLQRIFEEFHQIGNPERDQSRGIGLGLAIVQKLSRTLDHPVTVQSQPDQGSIFAIRVPLAETEAMSQPGGLIESVRRAKRRRRFRCGHQPSPSSRAAVRRCG